MVKKETHTSENAKLYELGFHILPTVAENKVADAFSSVTGIISNNGGTVVKSGDPKAIKLAYTITKKIKTQNERFNTAYFAWIKFNASSSDVEVIKKEVEQTPEILRFLLVKTVDDDEHSTAKLVSEEGESLEEIDESEMDEERAETADAPKIKAADEVATADDAKVVEAEEADEVVAEKAPAPKAKKAEKTKKEIDQIDEVIDQLVDEK